MNHSNGKTENVSKKSAFLIKLSSDVSELKRRLDMHNFL